MTRTSDGAMPTGRSARKRAAIIDAARTMFLQHGYAATSIDQVAALASVSKPTVYGHFTDKADLFRAIMTMDILRADEEGRAALDEIVGSDDLAAALRTFAREHVTTVLHPTLVQMRRIVIGEARRFPDLARAWYDTAIVRTTDTLAELFGELASRGRLLVDDPRIAADHFNWLVLSIPLNRAMFVAEVEFARGELERYADEGVRAFLAAYGP
jgi:TetR/AcrR family transcriptional regulator, mexJK operon transcriptional repressor